ncbi:hypothetical protein ACFW91_28615 [Streptomyces asoensis]|uniref:hypothetical protein n=1 Tax=Streptomyces asoensis TaxID=249586 RepID=UPI0036A4A05F
MTQRHPIARGRATNTARLAELHRLCDEDYAKGRSQRATPRLAPTYAPAVLPPVTEPSDLDVAIRVAQQLLDCDHLLSVREAMRLLLRALGAEPPAPAALPAGQRAPRCPAAHPDDPTPCTGPLAVMILDSTNAGAKACEHHGARLLASLEGGRVYALEDASEGAALRVFTAAGTTRPFPWLTDAPRTRDDQLSRAEVRARGERP